MTKKIEDIELNIYIDATQAQRIMELLSKTLCNLIDKCEGAVWNSDSVISGRHRIDSMYNLGRLYGIGQGK